MHVVLIPSLGPATSVKCVKTLTCAKTVFDQPKLIAILFCASLIQVSEVVYVWWHFILLMLAKILFANFKHATFQKELRSVC